MSVSLDHADIKILNLIQNDATLTNQDIAEITGVLSYIGMAPH